MKNIKQIKDKEDYIINVSEDNVINIIGIKGSGKTTTSLSYTNKDECFIVNCDQLFDMPEKIDIDKDFLKLKKYLLEKYGDLSKVEDFSKVYNSIIEYIKNKGKIPVIEGNIIQDLPIETIKGKIIIKRTSILKSFLRAVKRDYNNDYFMKLEKDNHKYMYKFTRLKKVTKRRLKIFKQASSINDYIELYESNNKKK